MVPIRAEGTGKASRAALTPFRHECAVANLAIMPSPAYIDGMTAPQLSVRSKKARDLAHALSRREGRPIHAIVEEALSDYARRHPSEDAAAFLNRLRVNAADDETIAELEATIEENRRRPHPGLDL